MAKDRYRFFRVEARELLDALVQGADRLSGDDPRDGANRMMRAAHTLKGAAGVVELKELSTRAHELEDLLAPFVKDGVVPGADAARQIDAMLDRIRAGVAAIPSPDGPPPAAPAPTESTAPAPAPAPAPASVSPESPVPAAVEAASETVRVPVAGLDDLLRATARARNRGRAIAEQLDQAHATADSAEAMRSLVDRLTSDLDSLWSWLCDVRMVPAAMLTDSVRAAASQAARAVGKTVTFDADGADQCIDVRIVTDLLPGLVHAARNAVDHGIESGDQRSAAGKPAAGRVTLRIESAPDSTTVVCEDDGRGFDVDAIARAAVTRGLLPADRASQLDLPGAIALATSSGFSSREQATAISGRGVGLQILGDAVRRLHGRFEVDSRAGHGTRIVARLPRSIGSLVAVRLDAGRGVAWLPLPALHRVYRMSEVEALDRSLLIDGETLPSIDLARWLGQHEAGVATAVAVIRDGARRIALQVHGVGEPREIVVQPLPRRLGACSGLLGATFDALGEPGPVIDPRTIGSTPAQVAAMTTADAPPAPPLVLVVDDSLTSRMVEQSILQTAGYEVDLAENGEQALQRMAQRRYDLVLCDIEMPGINGFELVRLVRAESRFDDLPIVLVTTLDSDADRRRGLDSGAAAWIVKTELDERELLRLCRRLARPQESRP
ncbi:MAG: response regulator [Planctomycetota bacterium]